MNYDITIENALAACFNAPGEPSRPGIDWNIRFEGEKPVNVTVRTYFAADASPEEEQGTLAEQAMAYLRYKLASGWLPEAGLFEVEE